MFKAILKQLKRLAKRAWPFRSKPSTWVPSATNPPDEPLDAARLEARIAELEAIADRQAQSILWLTERQVADGTAPIATGAAGPLVSVVMPTRDRAHRIGAAIESVLAQSHAAWELLIADDGSVDDTAEVVARYAAADPRVRLLPGERKGQCAARNRGLEAAAGDVIAYLDTDNTWYPGYLAGVVAVLARHPESESTYCAQLVCDRAAGQAFVRYAKFDHSRLVRNSFIDLNAFAHRRRAYLRYGGFDESLTRLVDWDLILRYTRDVPPICSPALGGRYSSEGPERVSASESRRRNEYRIRLKWESPVPRPLKVLYALWHYPQLSESYARWELEYMRRRGVEIEVWSELKSLPAPFPTGVPLRHGKLDDAIRRFEPDFVHVHWTSCALKYRPLTAAAGVPMTVRDHGFDLTPERMKKLLQGDSVARVYLFPHLARSLPASDRIRAMPVAFNGGLYPCGIAKDPGMVLRVGAALPTKDFATFFAAAQRCPDHRFVLALVPCAGKEAYLDELKAYNASLQRPVDLRVNLQAEEIAALMEEAGIYLHTHGLQLPFGMPISIAEAMGAGCWVLCRRHPAAASYLSDAGRLYDSADEAAERIRESATWSDGERRRVRLRSIERAYTHFADSRVLPTLLEDWLALAERRARTRPVRRQAA